jgi:hypothetical protein
MELISAKVWIPKCAPKTKSKKYVPSKPLVWIHMIEWQHGHQLTLLPITIMGFKQIKYT